MPTDPNDPPESDPAEQKPTEEAPQGDQADETKAPVAEPDKAAA